MQVLDFIGFYKIPVFGKFVNFTNKTVSVQNITLFTISYRMKLSRSA